MDTFERIGTKLDVREFAKKAVSVEIKKKILEAARLTGSGMNIQHWRFVLVQRPEGLRKLSEDSKTGKWVGSADFAILVLTDPKYNFHHFDAGRAVQDMQLAAWNHGVASGIYTGFDTSAMARDFSLPDGLSLTVVVGFGYPTWKVKGKKDRKPISELAYSEAYGKELVL